MDPELHSSLQDPNRSVYLEPLIVEEKAHSNSDDAISLDQVASSQSSAVDQQTHEAANNRFTTYKDQSDSLVAFKEHYQFRDWTHVISSSLTSLYTKIIKHEAKALERELEIERQTKKLAQYREHLQVSFHDFLSKLKSNH